MLAACKRGRRAYWHLRAYVTFRQVSNEIGQAALAASVSILLYDVMHATGSHVRLPNIKLLLLLITILIKIVSSMPQKASS